MLLFREVIGPASSCDRICVVEWKIEEAGSVNHAASCWSWLGRSSLAKIGHQV